MAKNEKSEGIGYRFQFRRKPSARFAPTPKSMIESDGTEMQAVYEKQNAKKMTPNPDAVRVIPLGGLDKIGMNITAFEYKDSIIIVDCGLSFPDEDMLGIDKVIPDITYLKENQDKVKAYFITHGHEDHIGALPYILPEIPAPIYATRLTMGLINHKLEEAKYSNKVRCKVIKHGSTVNLGDFRVEFIKTNHSIPDASALAIYTDAGIIVHTGDFKVDYTPLFGDPIDLMRLAIIGNKGVLAVMSDSTNAKRKGMTPSEVMVAKTIDRLFADYKEDRIIIATFASNVDRVRQIIDTAYKYGRKVVLQGRSMETVMDIAQKLEYITVPENTLIDVSEMNSYPKEQLVFITTGSQGEAMAALSRMADGTHRKVKIQPNDVVVFSSTPIPGNERAVSKVMNQLRQKDARVIFQDTHVSGHACEEELKLIYSLLKPKYAIPVHGEYSHRTEGARIAQEIGVKKENTFLLEAGDVLELSDDEAKVIGKVQAKEIFVDGLGVGDVGNIVIHDRKYLSEHGVIIITITLEKGSGQVLAGPELVSRGFVYVRESEELMNSIREQVNNVLVRQNPKRRVEWSRLKAEIQHEVSEFLWQEIKRTPMILPIISEVDI